LELLPGEKKIVDFELTEKELGFYDNKGNWILEKGDFEIFIGGNSQTNNKIIFKLK
jgi:beta-glucosidase